MLAPASLFLLTLPALVSTTCYFPNGDISPADVACNPSASDSACCYSDQACLSNGICNTDFVDGIYKYARGTCTDQTWQSGACPNFCLDQQALGNVMFSCNTTGVDAYCCNDGCSCAADTGDEVVSFTGTPYTISVIGQLSTYPNPSATLSSSITTSSSGSTSSSTPVSTTSSITSTSSGAMFSSSVSSAAATSSSSSSGSGGGGSNSTAIGVGVGVGVGVALIVIAAGAFFLRRRRSARQRQVSNKEHVTSSPPANLKQSYHHSNSTKVGGAPALASELASGGQVSELGTGAENMRHDRREATELPGS